MPDQPFPRLLGMGRNKHERVCVRASVRVFFVCFCGCSAGFPVAHSLDNPKAMVCRDGKSTMTHRTTFALDESTAQRLMRLAARWKERAEAQESTSASDIEGRLETARQLRASLRNRKVDVAAWMQKARDSRR